MADVAASVLARLKSKAAKSGRSYPLCLQLFARKSSCAAWKSQNMRKTLFSKADCSSIPSRILIVVSRRMWIFCSESCPIHRNSSG